MTIVVNNAEAIKPSASVVFALCRRERVLSETRKSLRSDAIVTSIRLCHIDFIVTLLQHILGSVRSIIAATVDEPFCLEVYFSNDL